MPGNLHTLRLKMYGFKVRVAGDAKAVFSAFGRALSASLLDPSPARQRGIGRALNRSMALLREMLAAINTVQAGW